MIATRNATKLRILLALGGALFFFSCSPAVEVTNKTSKQIYLTFDQGAENILATNQVLRKEFNGNPDADTVLKGSGNYLADFKTNLHLKSGQTLSLALSADVGRLRLINSIGQKISAYYFSAHSNAGWGSSLGTIDAGSEAAFRAYPGSWDLWVATVSGSNYYKTFISVELEKDVAITVTGTAFTLSAPPNKN